jgi:uncharacterized membrane protein YkvA (DUF1232 family)
MRAIVQRLRDWARALKRDVLALFRAARDPRTPWYAKALAALVAAYALSPIDLIPDFIPVLGYLDDLLLVPAGIWLCLQLIPPEVIAEHRKAVAEATPSARPVSRVAAAVIIAIWLLAAGAVIAWLLPARLVE